MNTRMLCRTLSIIVLCTYFAYVGIYGFAWAQQIAQQMPLLLTNDNLVPAHSSPHSFIEFKGETYFGAAGDVGGLWKTNGTADGTELIKNIRLYEPSIHESHAPIIASADYIFFMVDQGPVLDDSRHVYELWRSDGTESGTVRLQQFGQADWGLQNAAIFEDRLYFRGNDAEYGAELWVSNGLIDGTSLFLDINPGEDGSNVDSFAEHNGYLYFSAFDAINGDNVWRTNGSLEATEIAVDIDDTEDHKRDAYDLTVANQSLYFRSFDEELGGELWQSSGTMTGTKLITDSYPSPIGSIAAVSDNLFFENLRTLWHIDGTEQEANYLTSEEVHSMIPADNLLYFWGKSPTDAFDDAYWRSDGTPEGTISLKGFSRFTKPKEATVGDDLYFLSYNRHSGQLFRTDGTSEEVQLVKDLTHVAYPVPLPYPIHATNNGILFGVFDDTVGKELWKSDGTTDGTTLVKDIDTNVIGMRPQDFGTTNNALYFFEFEEIVLQSPMFSLWRSDGTGNGTVLLKTFEPDQFFNADEIRVEGIGSTFFFTQESKLWKTDGTPEGTTALSGVFVYDLEPMGQHLFFAQSGSLWKTNGTEEGTEKIKDVGFGARSNSRLYAANGTLFFRGYTAEHGYELWKSDGTEAGTVLVKDIYEGTDRFSRANSSHPDRLFSHNGILYFAANGGGYADYELWHSDGTEAGTELLKVINPNAEAGSDPKEFTAIGSASGTRTTVSPIFFSADHESYGRELWYTDGTADGTQLFLDIREGEEGSDPAHITSMGNYILFRATDGQNGAELWRSDGTVDGTSMVTDIRVGAYGTQLGPLLRIGDTVYFSANDGIHGAELWKSDGTASGTMMLFDLNPGLPSSTPRNLTYRDGVLYFSANDGVNGVQLRSISVQAPLSLDVVEEPEETPSIEHYIPFFSVNGLP